MQTFSTDKATLVVVGEQDDQQRLDNFLMKTLKGVPKSHIYCMIRHGEVRLDKKRASVNERIKQGQVVRVPPVRVAHVSAKATRPAPARNFDIAFEDKDLLVINKPSGIAVHGGSGISFGVIETLRATLTHEPYLELVHRLDKDTSGLLMVAKKRRALVRLHELMKTSAVRKTYLALGLGKLGSPRLHVKLPLVKYTGAQGEKMVRVGENGQAAHTIFQTLDTYTSGYLHQAGLGCLSLIEATLKTGRTHQIRVHLQESRCPIAMDERYGDYTANRRLEKLGLKHMFLHAHRLVLPHPISGEVLTLEAPLPAPLARFLDTLRCENEGAHTVSGDTPNNTQPLKR